MANLTYSTKNNKVKNISPTRLIVLSFAAVILTGTFLLMLPFSSRNGGFTGLITCLFTATSATCVTGLVVVDTYQTWSSAGQIIIMLLIQIGGLGIITLATSFSVILGRKVSLKGMLLAQESINYFSFSDVLKIIKNIVIATFCLETLGALLLSIRFIPLFGTKGIYYSIFHSVSSFCNAGFDLMGILDKNKPFVSMTAFNGEPVILYTMSFLIIIGGLGFTVWRDLVYYRKIKTVTLHTRIVITVTGFLIVTGALFFLFSEHNNTMSGFNTFEKINAAIFHSITPRTAGFNSLDTSKMKDVSNMITIIFMFIGAAPGSTGGGVKVTTFSVILFAILSQMKGSDDTIIFKRRVPNNVVNKALAIVGLSAILIIVDTILIMSLEKLPILNVLYEVTSAFGTVGLTTGITPNLGNTSRLILIITMFLGRVGPLSFAIALSLRSSRERRSAIYPEGKIIVG